MRPWLITLIPVSLVVIVLAYLLGSHAMPQSVQDNLANAAVPSQPDISLPDDSGATNAMTATDALPEASANLSAAEDADAVSQAPATDQAAQRDGDNAPDYPAPDATAGDADAQAQAQAEIGAAIREATLQALDDGRPVHWHKDGLAGDVAVSDMRDGPAGPCRTVSATMGTADDRRQSADHIWCRPADSGEWTAQ